MSNERVAPADVTIDTSSPPKRNSKGNLALGESQPLPPSPGSYTEGALLRPKPGLGRSRSTSEILPEGLLGAAFRSAGADPVDISFKLLKLSPFGHFADNAMLNEFAAALTVVDFSRGEELPSSPFYLVRKGQVNIVDTKTGDLLSTRHPADFINWTAEYQPDKSVSEASVWDRTRATRRIKYAYGFVSRRLVRVLGSSEEESLESQFDWGRYDPRGARSSSGPLRSREGWRPLFRLEGASDSGQIFVMSQKNLVKLLDSDKKAAAVLRKVTSACLSDTTDLPESMAATSRALDLLATYISLDAGERVALPAGIRKPPHFRDSMFLPLRGEIDYLLPGASRKVRRAVGSGAKGAAPAPAAGVPVLPSLEEKRPTEEGGGMRRVLAAGSTVGMSAMLIDVDDKCVWAHCEDAKCQNACLVACVQKPELPLLLERMPNLEQDLLIVGKTKLLRAFLAKVHNPLVEDADVVAAAAERCVIRRDEPHAVIVSQGQERCEFCIVLQGKIRVTTHDAPERKPPEHDRATSFSSNVPMMVVGPGGESHVLNPHEHEHWLAAGMAFGEGASLVEEARSDSTYSTCGKQGATLLMMPREVFARLFGSQRTFLAALHIKLMRERASFSTLISHSVAREALSRFLVKRMGNANALPFCQSVSRFALLGPHEAAAKVVGRSIVLEKAIMNANCVKKYNFVGAWPADLFAEAQQEALDSMTALLPQFVKSAGFAAADHEMGSYNASMLFAHLQQRELDAVAQRISERIQQLDKVACDALSA